MHRRQTLSRSIEVSGVGVHNGRPVRLRLRPAAAGTGIVFDRVDLGVRIPADLDYVGKSFYATVLEKDGHRVSTIEHLTAALYALQVDDVIVELDDDEVPILDGSARPFVDLVLEAGRVPLDEPRRYLTITRPLVVTHEEKRIAVYPCAEYRVTYAIDFDHPQLGYQELTASLWREQQFRDKISPARTFAFEDEVDALRRAGLARGGSLDNAVVVGRDSILNAELRFQDEFVRHKMLDLTGDLALLGRPLRGHVVAYRAGHDMHGRLARRIRAARQSSHLAEWAEQAPAAAGGDARSAEA